MNMRKILAVALALLMCVAMLTVPAVAAALGTETLTATYDKATQTVSYEGNGYIENADLQIFVIESATRESVGIGTGKSNADGALKGEIKSTLEQGSYELSVHYTTGNGPRAAFDPFEVTTTPTTTNALPPNITAQPQPVSVPVGGTANLSVTATPPTANGALTYQWYRNPTATVPTASGGTVISGATAANYSAPTATVGAISYYVVVTNTDDSATGSKTATVASNAATVTVTPQGTDTTAPVLSNGSANRTSDTAATVGFTTNEAGTAYYIVRAQSAAKPTSVEVKAGTAIGAVAAEAVTGKPVVLTAGARSIYIVVEDAAGNISTPLEIAVAAYDSTSQSGPGGSNSGGSGTSAIAPSPSPRPSATPAATPGGITINGEPSNIVFNEDGSVTLTAEDIASAGGSVVIGIPMERGGPTYVVVDIDGNIVPLSAFGDGYMYALLVKAGTYRVVENGKDFNDIDGHWAAEYIDFVTARELFLGTGGGAFSPDTSMTRAMFATVMSRIDSAELSAYEGSRFADVPVGEWYTQAVEWAAENGIVEGVGDGSFDPEAEITREEMAVMIGRYMRYANYDLPNTTDEAAFNDSADISSWAEFDVSIIQQAGIIVGKPGDLFDPQGIATRGEVATVITRFVEAILAE